MNYMVVNKEFHPALYLICRMAYKGSSPNINGAQFTEARPPLNYTANQRTTSPNKFGFPITPLVPYIPYSVPDEPGHPPRAHNAITMDDAGSEVEDAPIPRDYLLDTMYRFIPGTGAISAHESGGSAFTLGDGRMLLKRGGATLPAPCPLRQRLQDIPEIPIRPLAHAVSHHPHVHDHPGEVPTDTSRATHTVTATCSLNGPHGQDAQMEARVHALESKLSNEIHARHVASLFVEEESDARDSQIAELHERCALMQSALDELIQDRYERRRMEASLMSLHNVAIHAARTMEVYRQQVEDTERQMRTSHATLVAEVSSIIRVISGQINELKADYEALATQAIARCPAEPALSTGTTRSTSPSPGQDQQK